MQVRACWRVYNEEFSERVALLIKDMRNPAKKQLQDELAASHTTQAKVQTAAAQAAEIQTPQPKQMITSFYTASQQNLACDNSMNASKSIIQGPNSSLYQSPHVKQNPAKRASILKRSDSKDQEQKQIKVRYARGGSRLSNDQIAQNEPPKTLNQRSTNKLSGSQKMAPPNQYSQKNLRHVQQVNAHAPSVSIKGVKHVIANLDTSIIERRQDASCDNSMLQNTAVKHLLHTQNRGLKEPTHFHTNSTTKLTRPSANNNTYADNDSALRQKCNTTARLIQLTLEENRGTNSERKATSSLRRPQQEVQSFAQASMKSAQSQQKFDQIVQKQPSVSPRQPSGPASGRSHSFNNRGNRSHSNSRSPARQRNRTMMFHTNLMQQKMNGPLTSRHRKNVTGDHSGVQRVRFNADKSQLAQPSNNSVRQSSNTSERLGVRNNAKLFRMADRMKKGTSRMKSPFCSSARKKDTHFFAPQTTTTHPDESRFDMVLQTEVPDEEDATNSSMIQRNQQCMRPLVTEEICAKSQRNISNTILFNNGKGTRRESETTTTSVAEQKAILKQELQRDDRRKSVSMAQRFEVDGSKTMRTRSTSHFFPQDAHQELIDSAVCTIQQEKLFMTTSRGGEQLSRSRMTKSALKVRGKSRSRLMFSPRSQSRRSRRNGESKSMRSQNSKPDSPCKDTPGQIDPPYLPTPVMSFKGEVVTEKRPITAYILCKNTETPELVYQQRKAKMSKVSELPVETKTALTANLPSQNPLSYIESDRTMMAETVCNMSGEEHKDSFLQINKFNAGKLPHLRSANSQSLNSQHSKKVFSQENQPLIKLQEMDKIKHDFRQELGCKNMDKKSMLHAIKSALSDPNKQKMWSEYSNDIVMHLQSQIEEAYNGEITKQQLHLIGKILILYRSHVSIQIKGVLLDRMFNLLRDRKITRVPTTSFSMILTQIRDENLGWRFFIDSINKLNQTKEADEMLFMKSLSIVQGHFRQMPNIDTVLIMIFIEHLFLPHFENASTAVRKQVVTSLAELKLAMDVRILAQSQLMNTSFDQITHECLTPGRRKLVLIYFERLVQDMANEPNSQIAEGHRTFDEQSSSDKLSNFNAQLSVSHHISNHNGDTSSCAVSANSGQQASSGAAANISMTQRRSRGSRGSVNLVRNFPKNS